MITVRYHGKVMNAENLVSIGYFNIGVISDLHENSFVELIEEEFIVQTVTEMELEK